MKKEQETKSCLRCGTTLFKLQSTRLAGCSHCYETFQYEIDSLIGETPEIARDNPVAPGARLRYRLEKALAREEYELAARLRDELARGK